MFMSTTAHIESVTRDSFIKISQQLFPAALRL